MADIEIPLFRRLSSDVVGVALVDEDDVPLLDGYRWHRYSNGPAGDGRYIYAAARVPVGRKKYRRILMHRLIMSVLDDSGVVIDHRNHDGLDNRRANLRIGTTALNSQNRIDPNGRRFRGVYPGHNGRWRARLKVNQRRIDLGCFDSDIEAALAVDAERRRLMPFAEPDPAIATYLER